ncbi:MAG: carbohydrate-binding family 9-like protein, partial [Clostridia bacterium]
ERYLNFEFNSKGFMILHIGKDRHNRGALTDEYRKFLNVNAINEKDFWGITFEIPFSVFCSIFDKENVFVKGYSFTANFYKCADKFKFPHYGMWNEVDVDHPDYHLSQFFGEIVLG